MNTDKLSRRRMLGGFLAAQTGQLRPLSSSPKLWQKIKQESGSVISFLVTEHI
jgi:hypothetical protein